MEIKNIENTKAQMRKGTLEFAILLIIARGNVYAGEILSELHQADLIVVEGTLYPLLNRLKREELLEYTWQESPSGPPRKYYSLTEPGKDMIQSLTNTWKSLSSSIQSLISTYEKDTQY
jgi:PadR family transcriptional regulator PadR